MSGGGQLRHVPGDHCGTIAEVEITCAYCRGTGVTTRDVVPAGWIEALEIGGLPMHREPFFGKKPKSTWLCGVDCAALWFGGKAFERPKSDVWVYENEDGTNEVAGEQGYDAWEAAR